MEAFSVETVVRGSHVYKKIWTAAFGKVFLCRCEGNRFDPFAVVVMQGNDDMGHVPRKISSFC